MGWADIENFVQSNDPSVLASARGVEENDLAAFEQSVSIPAGYREFLQRCGGDAGTLHPLGPKWNAGFYRLAVVPPEDEFLENGLLRIGMHDDSSSITANDIYLDLSTSDGDDAMLVEHESDMPYAAETVEPRGISFLDQVAIQAFQLLQLEPLEHEAELISSGAETPTQQEVLVSIRDVLRRRGLREILVPSDRVVALASDDAAVLIEAENDDPFVLLDVRGRDQKSLGNLVELLLDNVASLSRADSPQAFE